MSIIISCLVAAIAIVAAMAAITYYTLAVAINLVIGRVSETERRISQLEKLNKEKTDETLIRNTRTSSYDAGARRRG